MGAWESLWGELTRLLLSAALGLAIGLERESHGRYAGIRTNLVVCLGSCLLMMVSLHLEEIFRQLGASTVVRVDPGRVASYAVAGMGFIGAGAIIKGKGTIRGLTTAASLWLVTGLGLAVGAGYVVPAVLAVAIALPAMHFSRRFRLNQEMYTALSLTCRGPNQYLDQITAVLEAQPNLKIEFVSLREDLAQGRVFYRFQLRTRQQAPYRQLLEQLKGLEELEELSWEMGEVP